MNHRFDTAPRRLTPRHSRLAFDTSTTALLDAGDPLESALNGDAEEQDYVLATPDATALQTTSTDELLDEATEDEGGETPRADTAFARGPANGRFADALYGAIAAPTDERRLTALANAALPALRAYFGQRGAGEECDALAANTLWRIVNVLPTLRVDGAITFFWTTAKNLLANHYRDSTRASRIFVSDDALAYDANEDGVRRGADTHSGRAAAPEEIERDLLQQELSAEVHHVVSNLSSEHREVLMASYHGFSLDEMASTLSIPVGTVKSRLHRARHAALSVMKPYLTEGRTMRARHTSAHMAHRRVG